MKGHLHQILLMVFPTSFGESDIQVPRDREASFDSIIIPKRQIMVVGLENVVILCQRNDR